MSKDKSLRRHISARGPAAKGSRKGAAGQPKAHGGQRKKAWRRGYYIPDYSIQRAARDLLMNVRPATSPVISKVAFALQDLVDDDDLENISAVEKESDSPFFLAIAPAVRKEARTRDPEYARPVTRQPGRDSRATEEIDRL